MSVCALIPLRAGGSRVGLINGLDKERALLGGKPLMAWTIDAAIQSCIFDGVYAVVASEQHAALAASFGAQIIKRPEYTVRPGSPDIEWMKFVLEKFKRDYGRYDAFAILRVTSPFRTALHIIEAWQKFQSALGADSLRAVTKVSQHPGKMWLIRQDRMLPLLPMGPEDLPWHSRATQEIFDCYVQTAGLEMGWSDQVLSSGTIAGSTIVPFELEMPAALDINTLSDWEEAEKYARS